MTSSLRDAIAGPVDPVPPVFACTLKDGLDLLWVHVAGGLDMATAPQPEQALHQGQQRARLGVLDPRGLTFRCRRCTWPM